LAPTPNHPVAKNVQPNSQPVKTSVKHTIKSPRQALKTEQSFIQTETTTQPPQVHPTAEREPKPIYPATAFLNRFELAETQAGTLPSAPKTQPPAPVKTRTAGIKPDKPVIQSKPMTIEKSNTKLRISTRKTNNTLKFLIERFQKTKDPKLATYIAKSFYNKKKYDEAVRWSVIANSLEPSNEASWLIFAKAKTALHQKEDAINALRIYLNQYPSKRVEAYLNTLESL
jgi:tetratricopeptide (TPR) repeat protein